VEERLFQGRRGKRTIARYGRLDFEQDWLKRKRWRGFGSRKGSCGISWPGDGKLGVGRAVQGRRVAVGTRLQLATEKMREGQWHTDPWPVEINGSIAAELLPAELLPASTGSQGGNVSQSRKNVLPV
jgi:hypothetical protein